MLRFTCVLASLVAGCEVVPPTGGVLEPVPVAAPAAPAVAAPAAPPAEGGFDFDAYKAEQAEHDGAGPIEQPADLAAELGADGMPIPEDAGAPPPVAAPVVAAPAPVAGPPIAAVEVALGVRLVSTLDGTVPPRAVLGLPDGQERVVQAGDLLPEARVVVLAVGRDLVQIAQITPRGDHAAIEPVFLRSLFPGGAAPAP
jgi:hypothetical protein